MKTSADIYSNSNINQKLFLLEILIIFILFSCAPKKYPSVDYIPEGVKKGIASWYGAEFHGRPTASGEIYNMYDYTCAHREYPFGTKLRVINLKNNKDVVCTVNDRGPFILERDLDLSYVAAKQIDLIGTGIAEVLMEPVGRDLSYVKYVKYSPTSGLLTIQVGAFKEIENAQRLKQALSLKFRNVYITEKILKGDTFYRVRIGKFRDYNEAYNLAKSMGQEGYKVIITIFDGGLKDEI